MKKQQTAQALDNNKIQAVPIIIALLIGGFFAMLNETSLNMALNGLMNVFNISAVTAQWLTTGYMLVIGILVPVSAFLMHRFTTRQLYLTSLIIFVIGTIIAGCSTTFSMLMIARIIQAIGTGIFCPLIMSTILVITPLEKRGSAMGVVGLVMMFAPAIGPTISGFILQSLSWRWLFFIIIPFMVFALVFGYFKMQNVIELTNPKADILSIVLSTIGFDGIIFGFSKSGEVGFTNQMVIIYLAVGFVALALFIWRQLTMETLLLNLRAFKYPMFSLGVILAVVAMMMIFANTVVVPMYLQTALGLNALIAGVMLLPGGVVNGILSPVTGKLYDKFGPKVIIPLGLIICGIGIFMLSKVTASTSVVEIVVIEIFLQGSLALIMMPAQTNGLNQLPAEYYAHGSAIMNTLQQIAGALGTSLFVSFMATGQRNYLSKVPNNTDPMQQIQALVAGVQHAFAMALIIVIVGFILSLFLKHTSVKNK